MLSTSTHMYASRPSQPGSLIRTSGNLHNLSYSPACDGIHADAIHLQSWASGPIWPWAWWASLPNVGTQLLSYNAVELNLDNAQAGKQICRSDQLLSRASSPIWLGCLKRESEQP